RLPARAGAGEGRPGPRDPRRRPRGRRARGERGVLMDRARALFHPLFLLVGAGVAAVLAVVACVDTASECALTLGRAGCIDAHGSPVGGGGTGGTTSTGPPGGGGTTVCTDASSCPAAPPGPCATLGKPVCTGGVCGVVYTPGDAPSQRYGWCHHNTC